jgi:morphogenetic protein associated with SpoVID
MMPGMPQMGQMSMMPQNGGSPMGMMPTMPQMGQMGIPQNGGMPQLGQMGMMPQGQGMDMLNPYSQAQARESEQGDAEESEENE